MTESLYDVLGVDRSASEADIKGAWRSLVTVLGPTDHRFAAINEAASVLLDADKRAEYDATLGGTVEPERQVAEETEADGPSPEDDGAAAAVVPEAFDADAETEPEPETVTESETAAPEESDQQADAADAEVEAPEQAPLAAGEPRTLIGVLSSRRLSAVAAALAVVLVVATALTYLLHDRGPAVSQRSITVNLTDTNVKPIKQQVTTQESADVTAAFQAAIAGVPKVLSSDYRTLAKNEADAKSVMTAEYAAANFTPYFDGFVKPNAPRLKQVVVCGPAIDVGVVRTAPNLVEVLVLFDRFATNTAGSVVAQNFADVTMVRQNGTWLISNFATAPLPK